MKSVFHEGATMYGKMKDGWVEGAIQNLYDIGRSIRSSHWPAIKD